MSKKKEDYENISAKMVEYHNVDVFGFMKQYWHGYGAFKIRRQKYLSYRDDLESSKNKYLNYDHQFTIEYLVLNNIIFGFLPKDEQDAITELLNSDDESNQIMGANMLYTLIENKKQQIKEKLKE